MLFCSRWSSSPASNALSSTSTFFWACSDIPPSPPTPSSLSAPSSPSAPSLPLESALIPTRITLTPTPPQPPPTPLFPVGALFPVGTVAPARICGDRSRNRSESDPRHTLTHLLIASVAGILPRQLGLTDTTDASTCAPGWVRTTFQRCSVTRNRVIATTLVRRRGVDRAARADFLRTTRLGSLRHPVAAHHATAQRHARTRADPACRCRQGTGLTTRNRR